MKFCPDCGSIMKMAKEGYNCSCGYSEAKNPEESGIISEKVDKSKAKDVVMEEKKVETHPLDKTIECPKCGHHGAYWWLIQTRSSDEPETQFFKCEKCEHQWREY